MLRSCPDPWGRIINSSPLFVLKALIHFSCDPEESPEGKKKTRPFLEGSGYDYGGY